MYKQAPAYRFSAKCLSIDKCSSKDGVLRFEVCALQSSTDLAVLLVSSQFLFK